MIREEAIKRLKDAKSTIQPFRYTDEAIDYAIKALEQEPCTDAISRHAVLNLPKRTMKNYFGEVVGEVVYVKDIMELPPVTPQQKTDTWSIKDVADTLAKHGLIVEQEPCEDAISRQAALECCRNEWEEEVEIRLKSLPPVTPQPKTGHWIDEFGGCECSECGCLEGGYSDYCPNCGAKMEEE